MIRYEAQIMSEDEKLVAKKIFSGPYVPRIGETVEILPVGSLDEQITAGLKERIIEDDQYLKSNFREKLLKDADFHNRNAGKYKVVDVENAADLYFNPYASEHENMDTAAGDRKPFLDGIAAHFNQFYYEDHARSSTNVKIPKVKIRKIEQK